MGESERARGGGGIRGWRSGVVILKNPTADAGQGTGATGLTGGETGGWRWDREGGWRWVPKIRSRAPDIVDNGGEVLR
jgi:hypothetical protein